MKTAYEIAWDLVAVNSLESELENLSKKTGISLEEVKVLRKKYNILFYVKICQNYDLDLTKRIIEEIDQGKPHWEIENE